MFTRSAQREEWSATERDDQREPSIENGQRFVRTNQDVKGENASRRPYAERMAELLANTNCFGRLGDLARRTSDYAADIAKAIDMFACRKWQAALVGD
jgi:hypothetical protein